MRPEGELPKSWRQRLATEDPAEMRLRLAGFRAVLAGRAVAAPDLAAELGLAVAEVRNRLADLAARGLVELDDEGIVIGCMGLSTRPTSHRLRIGERELAAWCAVDAVAIPAALEVDARIDAQCAGCGRPLRIDVVRGIPAAGEAVQVWVADVAPGRAMAGDT